MIKIIFILLLTVNANAFQSNWGGPSTINAGTINVDQINIQPDSSDTDPFIVKDSDGNTIFKIEENAQISILGDGCTEPLLYIDGITGATYQNIDIRNSDSSRLCNITMDGFINNINGFRTETTQYGAGLNVQLYGEGEEHEDQFGYYDHVGDPLGDNLFKLTSGSLFTQSDADNGTHILLLDISGSYPLGEIKQFINGSNVIIDGYGWDSDFASAGSPTQILSYSHPGFVSGDGGKHEFNVGNDGEVEIVSYDYDKVDGTVSEIELDAATHSTTGLFLNTKANGYTNTQSLVSILDVGDITSPSQTGAIVSIINTSGILTADGSEIISSFVAGVINGSDSIDVAYTTQAGFDRAFIVQGAPEIDPGYGYDVTNSVLTDRVNGVGEDGSAFLETSTTDITIFDNNNDYILIGRDSTFEIILCSLTTNASLSITPTFEYSTGNGTWSTLTLLADETGGFTSSGRIAFSAPSDWAVGNQAEAPADITSAYYVKITRTRRTLPTDPVENYFKIFDNVSAGMAIYGNGVVQLPYATTAPDELVNGMMWMESDGLHVYYNDTERLVSDGAAP